VGPSSFHNPTCQRPGTGCRPRLCLLKGCERRFTPSRPQSRYCGSLCAEAALRWRRVKASRCYRSGCEGRAKRREQNRHYRRRRRERTASVSDGISELDEGKRPACASENFAGRMCARPRWDSLNRVWVHPVWPASAMSTRIRGEQLFQDICQAIRAEKGIDPGQEIPF
jgi:hypothetical protein